MEQQMDIDATSNVIGDPAMKILVASDGSKNALRAIRYAAKLDKMLKERGKITLISVHDGTGLRHAQRFVGKKAVDDYLRELSDADLAEGRAVLDKAGVNHDMIIRFGHVAAEIIAAARKGQFDLVVLGSKGRSALKDLMIGSVATRVSAGCPVPVLIIK
jgi:nucleotide-binding universal stress UspA family protein